MNTIIDNDYNLSISSYVEQEDKREVIDIQKVNAEIDELFKQGMKLQTDICNIIADLEGK